jgi:hypothetical protein
MEVRKSRLTKYFLSLAAIALMATTMWLLFAVNNLREVQAAPDKVLILSSTVTGGLSSREALAAAALGYTVEVVDNAGWGAKTQADFAGYRALILGDATCTSIGAISAAVANKAVWGPVVNGNVIVIGTDPVFHHFQGGSQLTSGGIKFAADKAGKTGMYITLSCYYHDTAPMTPVPLLDAFSPGGFSVRGVGCFNDAHIVATHPALTGITDATLSNWSCSVHEAFDKWPVDFQVLAIARNIGSSFTASDGTVGTPYILARGVTVISDIKLIPLEAENPAGTSHTLTATVTTDTPSAGTPVIGTIVTFSVISGPNTGVTGTGVTDNSGVATFTYTSNGAEGTDFIKATFVDTVGRTQTSNTVTKKWVGNSPPVAKCKDITVSAGASCTAMASINDGSFDPDNDSITVSQSPPGPYPLGMTSVTLTVTDDKGASSFCTAKVTVVDTTAPVLNCSISTSILWSPNHNLVNVGLSAGATDNCTSGPNITVQVFGDEDDEEPTGDGTHSPDAKSIGLGSLRLRSERKGDGDGRVYLIVTKATDAAGNVSFCVKTVVVPHGQSQASIDSVNAQAATALAYCQANGGAPPPGYFTIGDGPVIGPKQ